MEIVSHADIKNSNKQQQQAEQGAAKQEQDVSESAAAVQNILNMNKNPYLAAANNEKEAKMMSRAVFFDQMRNGNAGQMAFNSGAGVGQMANAQALQNEADAMELAASQQDQVGYGGVSEYIDPAMASMAASDANRTMVEKGLPAVNDKAMDSTAMYRRAAGGPSVVDQQY